MMSCGGAAGSIVAWQIRRPFCFRITAFFLILCFVMTTLLLIADDFLDHFTTIFDLHGLLDYSLILQFNVEGLFQYLLRNLVVFRHPFHLLLMFSLAAAFPFQHHSMFSLHPCISFPVLPVLLPKSPVFRGKRFTLAHHVIDVLFFFALDVVYVVEV